MRILDEAVIPELPNYYRGKVRENYDLPDGNRIIISTDRLSAFDRILTCVPYKGQVLTQTARYWFEQTKDICPNHVVSYPDPNVVIGKRLEILPVEVVVRGYLVSTTGTSILTLYKKGQRQMYGMSLPDGMKDNQILPEPVITPTSKALDGGHDEPLTLLRSWRRNFDAGAMGHAFPLRARTVQARTGDCRKARPHPRRYEIRIRHR